MSARGGPAITRLAGAALDRLMPMHLVLDGAGSVLSHGPTLGRIFGTADPKGQPLTRLFDIRGPEGGAFTGAIGTLAGQKLRLATRGGKAPLRLRGIVVPLAEAEAGDGGAWLVNLSFGIDLPRAAVQLQLTDTDFAVTDLAMEMLYLVEANLAVTGELRGLARRLDGARNRAREEAMTDPLTGLRNRRACDSVLARLCAEGAAFGLIHMDLDHFKAVNDRLGHAAGDHVLAQVAEILKSGSRSGDCIARVGGDEFVLLLPGLTSPVRLQAIARRMIARLSRPIPFQGSLCQISASFGFVASAAGEAADPARLLAEADLALYAAKKAGRGCALAFDPTMAGSTRDETPPDRIRGPKPRLGGRVTG